MEKTKFKVSGIKCGSCVMLIEDRLKNDPGIIKIKVDENSCKGVAVYDDDKTDEEKIFEEIEKIDGFKVEKIETIKEENKKSEQTAVEFSGISCPYCGKQISLVTK